MLDMRVRSLWSPYYLSKVVLGYRELTDYFHLAESEVFIRNWASGICKQWIEWPRGFFKSTLFTVSTGIWIVCPVTDRDSEYALDKLGIPEDEWFSRANLHDQDATQLLAYETDTNSKKKVAEVRWHFEENELFRSLFPEIAYTGKEEPWSNQCLKIRRAGYGKRLEEGTFEAIGVGGALQSRHYKIVWEDDLVGKKATESEVVMEGTIRWHGLLHGAFQDATRQIRWGVSNRWGYNDLNSHIRKNEPDFVFHTRKAIEYDEDGKAAPAFPVDGTGKERFTLDELRRIEHSGSMTSYDFSCQYMNSPKLPGESEFDANKLHEYRVESDGAIVCSCGDRAYPSALRRYMHYDPYNAKGNQSKSRPAIVVVGTNTTKHRYLLDYWETRGDYAKVYDKLFSMNDAWQPCLFTYEDVGHQNMTAFHIREMERNPNHRDKHLRFPRIEPAQTQGKAKEVRIRENLLTDIEKGGFSIRSKHRLFKEQLETFPNPVLDHDYDLLDATAQGRPFWQFPLTQDEDDKQKRDDDEYTSNLGRPYGFTEARA